MKYNELYEVFRKEKYSDVLQVPDKNFLLDFSKYLKELRERSVEGNDFFSESFESKKQLENSIAIFRGLILRRKRKLLNLVFVAAETGIMKKDYDNMLDFEKKIFDKLVKAVEDGDKELSRILSGREAEEEKNKMIIFNDKIDEFVDMNGNVVGPFSKGELVNLDAKVCEVLVGGGKASFVDE